jgi:hypothetical protein
MRPLTVPLSIPQMIHEWMWSSDGKILTGENRRTRRKTCPSATSSTKNHKWTVLGAKPGLRGEKPATNSLSYGTAVDNIKVGLKRNRASKDVDWIRLVQDRVRWRVLWNPGSIKGGAFLGLLNKVLSKDCAPWRQSAWNKTFEHTVV